MRALRFSRLECRQTNVPRCGPTMTGDLPVTSNRVDLTQLHPRFVERLRRFFADPLIEGRVQIVSAGRSYAEQSRLFEKYKHRGGNLAADPNRVMPGGWRGSWHMEQEDGYCYAVDFRIVKKDVSTTYVTHHAKKYGLVPTVPSEWWHFQPRDRHNWFDAPALATDSTTYYPPLDWAALVRMVEEIGRQVAASPLRRGARGFAVEVVQRRLGALGYDTGPADEVFGRKTRRAVKGFQRVKGLTVDGVVGGKTWRVMWL